MRRFLALVTATTLLSACAFPLHQEPAPAVASTESARFAKRCLDFYEIVADLTVQRRIGGISADQADAIDPFIEAGHTACQNDGITNFDTALEDLEKILADISEEQGTS